MGGKTKKVDTRTTEQKTLQQGAANQIVQQGYGSINAAAVPDQQRVQVAGVNPVNTNFTSGQDIDRSQVRDVASVDSLGGANSAFFQNMMAQLQPSFTQARDEGLAAAKESAGSLTGSGFANRLGASINRSLGNEQATLAQYASQGIGQELQRQQANQNADLSFMNDVLQRNQQGLQAQQLSSQAEQFNAGQQQQTNQTQAQLDAQRAANIYGTSAQMSQNNANNFLNLLLAGQGNPNSAITLQKSGGIGSVLAPIGGALGTAIAGPIGGAIGGAITKKVGG